MNAADLAVLAAGLPALAILYRRARRWQLARITDEQQHAANLAKWRKIDKRHHAEERRTADKMERRARRIDDARRYYQQQDDRARRRANARRARAARRYAVAVRVLAGKDANR